MVLVFVRQLVDGKYNKSWLNQNSKL